MTTTRKGLRAQELVLCGIFSALIAVGAFLRVPVPLVPFTLQLFFVTMAGFVLGPRLGAVSALVYVALGLLGVPIFTEGGGLGYVFKPTFGYLISFALAAYVTGKIAHAAKEPSYARLALAAAAGLTVSYAIGVAYLYCITNFVLGVTNSLWSVFMAGCLLVLPGNAALEVIAVIVVKRIWPHLRVLGE